ncbi:uncharacterized protein LOC121467688 [Drosophila elegans]|uniref:uncharacterized protein LOC121467688 n=1 Tax=Drosophila elegans TaxID=30023 RepID=UPI001BC8463C|nr:uncharacterized protein LOC121467688 [Drosophila elegans]
MLPSWSGKRQRPEQVTLVAQDQKQIPATGEQLSCDGFQIFATVKIGPVKAKGTVDTGAPRSVISKRRYIEKIWKMEEGKDRNNISERIKAKIGWRLYNQHTVRRRRIRVGLPHLKSGDRRNIIRNRLSGQNTHKNPMRQPGIRYHRGRDNTRRNRTRAEHRRYETDGGGNQQISGTTKKTTT